MQEEVDEKTQPLRDDLGRGSGFVNGKLRIAEYFEQHQPTDKELAAFLQKEYGIGGHSGPDMPNLGYDSKGIHIISADKKGNYRYTWAQAAKAIRRMIEQGEYILPEDIRDAVDHSMYYLEDVEHLEDHERDYHTGVLQKLRNHPYLDDSRRKQIDMILSPDAATVLSPAAKYIMNEDNMPLFVDRMVARDEMDEIAQRILDNGEDAAAVAQDYVDASRYIISDHETFAALATEIALSRMHGKGRIRDFNREDFQLDAESISYILCRRFGIERPLPDAKKIAALYDGYNSQERRTSARTPMCSG